MAENPAATEAVNNDTGDKDGIAKPLEMSFADWKKTKETQEMKEEGKEDAPPAGTRNGRKLHKNDQNKQHGNNRNHNNNNNNNNQNNNNNNNSNFSPLSRPPPLPFPLMTMGYGNFGSGPCPGPMMPPCNMGNMGPGPSGRNHRPLQPPPFWEDMMSPQHRPPPIQPPMPKCPSLWNLVPKEKHSNPRHSKHSQSSKKYKTSSNKTSKNTIDNELLDAVLMPPPPPPGSASNSSSNSSANRTVKKKKSGGTFVQIEGKWIQRPEAPPPLEEAPAGSKEDRQRQWKEYRQAMKPFKNREFHNWKRTVQRLSKLPRESLDEKQLERLQKAEEYIGAHKAMLTIKHAEHWVQQSNQKANSTTNAAGQAPDAKTASTAAQGQVFVRKPVNATWNKSNDSNSFQRTPLRKHTFGTGRAIKGGLGGDMVGMPQLPPTAPPVAMSPYTDALGGGGYFNQTPGYDSNIYGQDVASTSSNINSNPFYDSYSSSFVKGNTLLPP